MKFNRMTGPIFGLSLIATVFAGNTYARMGGETGGGGDLCEDRIKVIVADLQSWIDQSGPKGLSLPQGISVAQYSQAMLKQISDVKAECVSTNDPGYPVLVDGTPKVCKFEDNPTGGRITCDYTKFMETDQSDQYVLIHHELAGLAGLELPNKDDSHYEISNQISGYLQDEVVKKLVVKSAGTNPQPSDPCQSDSIVTKVGDLAAPMIFQELKTYLTSKKIAVSPQASMTFDLRPTGLTNGVTPVLVGYNAYELIMRFELKDGTPILANLAYWLDRHYDNEMNLVGCTFHGGEVDMENTKTNLNIGDGFNLKDPSIPNLHLNQ
jgi:hypothetical protein